MKKSSFLLAMASVCLSSSVLFAQETAPVERKTNEVNIILDDIFVKYPSSSYVSGSSSSSSSASEYLLAFYNIPKVGLGYKYNLNSSAVRSKLTLGSTKYESNTGEYSKTKYNGWNVQAGIGYEWQRTYNKVQIFYGLDLFVSKAKFAVESSYSNTSQSTQYGNTMVSSNTKSDYDLKLIGLSPFLGVKYFVLPNLSLSTEVNFKLQSFKSTSSYKYSSSTSESNSDLKGTSTSLGPVGNLGINIYF